MRLKQLLGILLSLLVLTTMAAAGGTHLTAVQAQTQGAATTVTIQASSAFTHTEYRPKDNTLLVDMAGMSPGALDSKAHEVRLPGLISYRVIGFKGASGAETSRVELQLDGAPVISLSDSEQAVVVRISGGKPVDAASPKAAAVEPIPTKASGKPVSIHDVGVVNAQDGMAIEVRGSGALTGKVLKLTSPDRLVIDIPNAVGPLRSRTIAVGSGEVKDIRMARYQVSPPVTRVVVDLTGPRDYELAPQGNKLVLKLHAPLVASAGTIPAAAAGEQPKAQDFVVVEPQYRPKTEMASAQPDPSARAADAAAHLGQPTAEVPLAASVTPAPAVPQAASNPAATVQQPATPPAKKFTGEPLSINVKDADILDFFRLVHEISGLNVVLDPNVKGRITLVLDDVPWDQALDIVLKNNGLDMQLDGNVLRIATVETLRKEADARRAQAEAQALAADKITVTRFLSYAHARDIVPTVKRLLTQRGDVFADERTNALIIQDIAAVFPAVDRLLSQLDRKTQEVEIEARVVAASRNFARDIGTQMGFGWAPGRATTIGGVPAVGTSPYLSSLVPEYTTVGTGGIPLFSNLAAQSPTSGIGAAVATNTYRLDFYLSMAESRGLLKVLSRPRVVTQNNIQALVRQGVRIPIVTTSQLGGPPTSTYVDAFLRLTVTPQITAENTIFLNVDVENTLPDFGHTNVLGNPTLITQQATTQVLVTDGGTVVIGGVIQTQNTINITQVPLLGNIPVLGNLFKRRSVTTQTQELIFFITPKIIQT